jgi:hypothetical protein
MKRDFLILLILLVGVMCSSAWAVCPQEPNDAGKCDTMYVQPWGPDVADSVWAHGGPYIIRVPVYFSVDSAFPDDKVWAIVTPFCYTHSNPAAYCSISAYYNRALFSNVSRSIFRDMTSSTDTAFNWMMNLWNLGDGGEWDNITLTTDNTSTFWLSLIGGGDDPPFGPAIHTLMFTMTFRLQDTMTVCIDSCFWPPSGRMGLYAPLEGGGETTVLKVPRPGNGTSSFRTCFNFRPSDVKETEGSTDIKPEAFSLSQNYPNPFNPTTSFEFTLPKSSHVKIDIFNIVGQKVATVVDGDMKAGVYTADWNGLDENGKSVSSGIYFYRMRADEFSDMKKMVLIK